MNFLPLPLAATTPIQDGHVQLFACRHVHQSGAPLAAYDGHRPIDVSDAAHRSNPALGQIAYLASAGDHHHLHQHRAAHLSLHQQWTTPRTYDGSTLRRGFGSEVGPANQTNEG